MAWNPSPEVQVARDTAKVLGDAIPGNPNVDRVIVLYTTSCGQIGFASYGETKALCANAAKIGKAAYAAAYKILENQ